MKDPVRWIRRFLRRWARARRQLRLLRRFDRGYRGCLLGRKPTTPCLESEEAPRILRALRRKGRTLLHMCDNRQCVRPDHLFYGTQSDNVRDCVLKGRHGWGGSAEARARREAALEVRVEAYREFGRRLLDILSECPKCHLPGGRRPL